MEIAVKTEFLKKVVSCASKATSNKAIQPILSNILLSCDNGSLTVSATDLDLAIECKLPAEVSKPGRITLPAKKLDEIVSKIAGDDINLKIDKNQLTKIVSNKSKFQINGTLADEFPEIFKKSESDNVYSIDQNKLLEAISLTSFATSKFENTSILSGINFEISGDKFEIGATDGSRLAVYNGNLAESKKRKDQKSKQSVVIPWRALTELERLISNFREGNEVVSFYFLPGQVIFQNNDFSLSTRLLEGTFPSYDKLIPKDQPNKVELVRNDFLSALERVAILANERTNVIKLSFTKNSMQLSANSPDYGNATDEIEVKYNGNDMDIAFNYRYMSEVLRNLKANKITLELDNALTPIILKPDEKVDYSYTYLVMPVQLR